MTFKHKTYIPIGVKGEFSYILEEVEELRDTVNQNNTIHSVVEAADVISAISKFCWKQYRVPISFVILLFVVRRIYKPIRNWYLDNILRTTKTQLRLES